MKNLILALAFLIVPLHVSAKDYTINHTESAITFSGTHAGNDFDGAFEQWDAVINFDENNLSESAALITIQTVSAKTGNAMYDGTLPTSDWFDADTYPTITFTAAQFEKTQAGFTVRGDLSVKDQIKPMTFNFDLSGEDPKIVTAEFPIDRLIFGVGGKSDPAAEWVSQNIMVNVKLVTQ